MEFLDPGVKGRELLNAARQAGVVLDYAPVRSNEDLSDGEVLRRAVLFTARGFCQGLGIDPRPEIDASSVPGRRISVDDFYGWGFDRIRRRLLFERTGFC